MPVEYGGESGGVVQRLARLDSPDRRRKIAQRHTLGEKPHGTRLHRSPSVAIGGVHRDDQCRRWWIETIQDLDPSGARHVDVEQQDVRATVGEKLHEGLTVANSANHPHIGQCVESLSHPVHEELVVVGHDYVDHCAPPQLSRTVVPIGPLSTSRRPSIRPALSRIPINP